MGLVGGSKKDKQFYFISGLVVSRSCMLNENLWNCKMGLVYKLARKAPITTAADDIHKYFFVVFQRK